MEKSISVSDAVGYIGNMISVFNFFKELVDQKISMKEEHSTTEDPDYLTIRFTAVDTKSLPVKLFQRFFLIDETKPWGVLTKIEFGETLENEMRFPLDPKKLNKFEQIYVKFPKNTSAGKEAYNTMVNAYHNLDLVDQFKVLTYLKHLCDPNVSSFRDANFKVTELSKDFSMGTSNSSKTFTNFKMELTIS
jgi:hypothetical protein